jgi:hypothetical protein
MKKAFFIYIFVILSICFTACVNGNNPIEHQNIGEDTMMYGDSNDLEQADKRQEEAINASVPTEYETIYFTNVDDLIYWIKTVDIDTFQEGRYKNGIASLRRNGNILVPSYSSSDIRLRGMEVLPDNNLGLTEIVYVHSTENIRNVITVTEINETYAKQANEEGVRGYLAEKHGDKFRRERVLEAEISTKANRSARESRKKVQYVKVIDTETSAIAHSQIHLLSDGFEVRITQQQDAENERFLSELSLETMALNI